MPKVSIITASYNYEKYINETIESVLNQSYKDWELIIVDDGSTDNSVEVIKSYCDKDSRIKLFQHKNNVNKGLGETIKLGINKAKSQWLVFLESDDTITPNYLDEKFKVIEQYPNVECIFNDVNVVGEQIVINRYKNNYLKKIMPRINKLKYPTKMLFAFQSSEKDNLIPTFSVVMIKKDLFKNIDFNSPIKPYLDWYIWLQIVNKNKCEFFYLDKKLTNWRMHKSSFINTKFNDIDVFLFDIKKSILLFKFPKLFSLLIGLFKLIRRSVIRIHSKEGEIILCGCTYKFPFLSKIYSKQIDGCRVKYRILGIKISKKIKYKRQNNDLQKLKNTIIENINSDMFDYISFDIFDTLLVRPCINPSDIFSFIAEKVDLKYGIDFVSMRKYAENGLINANIYDIYETIKIQYNLSDELKELLLKEEIAIETKLLSVREDVKEFYDLAVKKNKKIIAISDMYLPSNILDKILKEKGFDKISQIYVSNEYNARKDDGELFDIVINDLETDNIFHIGDNIQSDYIIPKRKNIEACYYPKIIDILSTSNVLFNRLINDLADNGNEIANRNIFIGFILNNYWFNHEKFSEKILNSLTDFANLFLAPYLCYIAFVLQKNAIIQNSYNKIYFVARDGFLPNKIYNMLNFGKFIPSEYIYGSRIAYWTGTYSSIFDLLKKQYPCFLSNYTLRDFLNSYIADNTILSYLKEKYTENELNLTIKDNLFECLNLLKKEEKKFREYYNEQNMLAGEYYNSAFENEKQRVILFDVGYSGSVSYGISGLTKKTIDKVYIHETSKNIYRDNRNKTFTYILKNGIESNIYSNLDLLLEECFSPLEGTCKGFKKINNTIIPIFDNTDFSEEMKNAHKELNVAVEFFVKKLIKLFGEYIEYLNVMDINPIFECINKNFKVNKQEKDIFNNIIFNDTATMHKQISLAEKIKI